MKKTDLITVHTSQRLIYSENIKRKLEHKTINSMQQSHILHINLGRIKQILYLRASSAKTEINTHLWESPLISVGLHIRGPQEEFQAWRIFWFVPRVSQWGRVTCKNLTPVKWAGGQFLWDAEWASQKSLCGLVCWCATQLLEGGSQKWCCGWAQWLVPAFSCWLSLWWIQPTSSWLCLTQRKLLLVNTVFLKTLV